MSNNRLYLYDPESNEAIMLAKGYGNGWTMHATDDGIDDFLEGRDFPAAVDSDKPTKLQLRTEADLPADAIRKPSE